MKRAIPVLIVVFPLLVLGFTTDTTSANSDTCQQIRQVRRLAIRENLDDDNLATLEYQYCATAQPPNSITQPSPTATQDCVDLTVMTRLARIAEGNSNLVSLVESQQLLACGFSEQWGRSSFNYPNGQTAKFGSIWNYPNGQTAKFGSNWNYPNGKTAQFGSTWNYPNGQTAKFASIWNYPNGTSTSFESLLSWACSILGREGCATRLLEVRNTNDFWSELAMVELSWNAYTMITQPTFRR